jgi:hypothetical protein
MGEGRKERGWGRSERCFKWARTRTEGDDEGEEADERRGQPKFTSLHFWDSEKEPAAIEHGMGQKTRAMAV